MGPGLSPVGDPGGKAPRKLLKSSILWTKKMYFRDCKTLSVFERKIPLTFSLEFRFHQDHAQWIPPPPHTISLLNISAYRLQPRLFMDSPPYLKKKRTIKSYGFAARLDQAIVIKA